MASHRNKCSKIGTNKSLKNHREESNIIVQYVNLRHRYIDTYLEQFLLLRIVGYLAGAYIP